jgi:hypothetical protein
MTFFLKYCRNGVLFNKREAFIFDFNRQIKPESVSRRFSLNLSFDRIIYDFVYDKPTAILKNEDGKQLYFGISPHTAIEIVNYNKNINNTKSNVKNIIVDLFKLSQSVIEKITIEKRDNKDYNGYLLLKNGMNSFCYYLSLDDLIIFSILFNKPVEADPIVFFDFLDTDVRIVFNENARLENQIMK